MSVSAVLWFWLPRPIRAAVQGAGVAESVDARDSKSRSLWEWGFKSLHPHQCAAGRCGGTGLMDRETIAAMVREHAAELRTRGVTGLGLFGSTARGESGETSDIDIVVDVAPGRKFSLIDLAGLRAYLCDLFQHETDVVVREDLRPSFREEIERDTVRVL